MAKYGSQALIVLRNRKDASENDDNSFQQVGTLERIVLTSKMSEIYHVRQLHLPWSSQRRRQVSTTLFPDSYPPTYLCTVLANLGPSF